MVTSIAPKYHPPLGGIWVKYLGGQLKLKLNCMSLSYHYVKVAANTIVV